MGKKKTLVAVFVVAAAIGAQGASEVTVSKPYMRWLWGGFGWQHCEATLASHMSDEFRDERAVKSFLEIRPTFARVYTGFAGQSKDSLDSFADYYDRTFRKVGTTLYVVPCCMPVQPDPATRDVDEFAEGVAKSLDYLVNVRACTKIRYFCLCNEMTAGTHYAWFDYAKKLDLFKRYNQALSDAFRRHGLDIGLVATDRSTSRPDPKDDATRCTEWALKEMEDLAEATCTHLYVYGRKADDLGLWGEYNAYFTNLVQASLKKHKRYFLGEFGFAPKGGTTGTMVDDLSVNMRAPELANESVLCMCEIALSTLNAGAYGCLAWSFCDYPDPMIAEDGDTSAEHVKYAATRCVYRPDLKYNKWGSFRWGDTEGDYRAYPAYYALGWLAKLFRKGATVLPVRTDDARLRVGAVMNRDRSVSFAVVNRADRPTEVRIACEAAIEKPLRTYVYEAERPPFNEFNDLQPSAGLVTAKDNAFTVTVPAKSVVFYTTDYVDRTPPSVEGVAIKDGVLVWRDVADGDHAYYRVFCNGRQIASTVATSCRVKDEKAAYSVVSVDRWGNVGSDML